MNLSKNFTLEEMLESQAARRKGISEQFTPPKEAIDNLKTLCVKLLQPVRDKIGKPILISSGYRCKRTNRAVGGKATSHHIKGMAADINGVGYSNRELFFFIKNNFKFTQLIWEYGDKKNPAWVHVSYDPKNLKNEILYIGV